MKKNILTLLILLIFSSYSYADKLLKDGFLNYNMNYAKDQSISDPKKKNNSYL